MTIEEKIAFQNGFATGYKIAKGMVFKGKEQSEKLILTYNITSTTLQAFSPITEATNYTIDWGDGTVNSNTITHVYSKIGTYTISVTFEELFILRFINNTSLIEVDGKLDNLRSDFSAEYIFYGCSSLSSISSYLFDECINVTNFGVCFYGCSSLTSIPSGLFDSCINVTSFYNCFRDCINLTGNAPTLWERANVTGYSGCFSNCFNLSNYEDIPYSWK